MSIIYDKIYIKVTILEKQFKDYFLLLFLCSSLNLKTDGDDNVLT